MGYGTDSMKRVIPVLAVEMLVPLMLDSFFSGTYVDFATWVVFVIVLDVLFPNVLPLFETCNFTVRSMDLIKLFSIWVTFKNAMFLLHLGITNCDFDYNNWYYIDVICAIRHTLPVLGVITFSSYAYFASFKRGVTQARREDLIQETLEAKTFLDITCALTYYAKCELGRCFAVKTTKKNISKPSVLASGDAPKVEGKEGEKPKRTLVVKRIDEALGIFSS